MLIKEKLSSGDTFYYIDPNGKIQEITIHYQIRLFALSLFFPHSTPHASDRHFTVDVIFVLYVRLSFTDSQIKHITGEKDD